ncbi:MAG: hypothetical protein ACK41V_16615, partial [Acidovorax sp.]|uniref:hypothetical protein n=1 Tax=Acidovorax sp. TaxID=1872122 RepID=UPI00391DCCD0
LQDLDSVVLHPASALGAEVAFLQRADAVACQVVMEFSSYKFLINHTCSINALNENLRTPNRNIESTASNYLQTIPHCIR